MTEFEENQPVIQYGSGYPGGRGRIDGEFKHCLDTIDPQTKRFLNESLDHIFGFPKFVRFSWSTASTIIEKSCMKISW